MNNAENSSDFAFLVKTGFPNRRLDVEDEKDFARPKYQQFMQRCAAENPDDPRLQTGIIPFVIETHGAAGPEACRC